MKTLLRNALGKVRRVCFATNNALWFEKDLKEPSRDIDAGIPVKIVFTEMDTIINWIKAHRIHFPWIYVDKELGTARSETHIYPFAVHEDKIIGYIKIGLNRVYIQDYDEFILLPPRGSFIYDTFVLPEYRGKRIAALLVQEAVEYLRERGHGKTWCHIPRWNVASIRVYKHAGFHEVAYIRFVRLLFWKFYNLKPEKVMQNKSALSSPSSRRTFLKRTITALLSIIIVRDILRLTANSAFSKGIMNKGKKRKGMNGKKSTVISVHSTDATHWDFKTYPYVDYIRQDVVRTMLHEGVREFANEKTSADGWRKLFASYRPGDKVAIKPNFNDLYNNFNGFVASPEVINAILDGLINTLKIPAEDIIVYDCTRIIPDEFRNRIYFPIKYVEPFGSSFLRKIEYRTFGNPLPKADLNHEIKMSSDVKDKEGNPIKCYLPNVVTSAQHIINVPILKSHQFISHSGALKNHYGTVRFSDGHTGPEYLHPPLIDQSIADINGHEQIRGKTRLIVMDALFGRVKKKGGLPDRWKSFLDNSPNRLFISVDPVALDSISHYFIEKELESRRDVILSHEYLHIAHETGLGVHEDIAALSNLKQISFREIGI